MKKYEGVLKRVRELEKKRGIHYATPDGKLYMTFNVLHIIMTIWGLGTNLLFILGHLIMLSDSKNKGEFQNRIITVSVCSLFIIAGYVLNKLKKKSPYILSAAGTAVTVVPSILLLVFFSRMLHDDFGFLGFSKSFYFRHFIPLVLLSVFYIVMVIITVVAEAKTDRMYKKVTENIYNMYREKNVDVNTLTDEQWNDILMNFNPYYKPVITNENDPDEQ